jgi:hypothetical protein
MDPPTINSKPQNPKTPFIRYYYKKCKYQLWKLRAVEVTPPKIGEATFIQKMRFLEASFSNMAQITGLIVSIKLKLKSLRAIAH